MRKRIGYVSVALVGLLVAPGLTPTTANPIPAEPGFVIEAFTTSITNPFSIGFGEGGGFGNDLYVTTLGGDLIRVDVNGVAQTVATGLGATLDGFAFGSGANGWTSNMYINTSHFDMVEVTPSGVATFHPGTTNTSGPLERGQGAFGDDLYFGGQGGFIGRLDNALNSSVFVSGLPFMGEAIVFAPVSVADPVIAMYASMGSGTSGTIYRIDSTGSASALATVGGGHSGIAYDPSGLFGGGLFVGNSFDNSIYRVSFDGDVSLFASGFGDIFDSEAIAFGPDGALYVSDRVSDTIWRIIPEPSTAMLLLLAGLVALKRRR